VGIDCFGWRLSFSPYIICSEHWDDWHKKP
jgi:hypothetical protein